MPVSTHSRLKAAGQHLIVSVAVGLVSTHSRLKAAGLHTLGLIRLVLCFNTQPPKGGWSDG